MKKTSNKILVFTPEILYFLAMVFLLLIDNIIVAIAIFIVGTMSEIYIQSKVKMKKTPFSLGAMYFLLTMFLYNNGQYVLCVMSFLIYSLTKAYYNKDYIFEE